MLLFDAKRTAQAQAIMTLSIFRSGRELQDRVHVSYPSAIGSLWAAWNTIGERTKRNAVSDIKPS